MGMSKSWRTVTILVVMLLASPVRAEVPLTLVPQEADFVLAITRPAEALDKLWNLVHDERVRSLPNYDEIFEQVSVKRLMQLVRYAEKELGKPWRQLVEDLAGDGILLAGKYGPQPSPVLLIVQGRDPDQMQRAAQLLAQILEQELARRDLPHQRQEHQRANLKVSQIGATYYAVHKSALLVSNRVEVFDYVAPLTRGETERSLARAEKWLRAKDSIPPAALAWAWLDLQPPKQLKEVQQALTLPGDLAIVHALFGRYLDIFKRSDFVTAHLTTTANEVLLTVQTPAGWKGASLSACTQIPVDGRANLRNPLQVPGMIYSSSFYFDPGAFVRQREKLLTEAQRQAFEEFDKSTAKFLLGNRFSDLVMKLGARHRLIVAQPDRKTYSYVSPTIVPSFALIFELQDAEQTGKRLEALLRGAAFLATFKARLQLVEEEHGGVKLVGYRFADNETNRAVQNGLLFNFSPCFAQVGDQFMLCSTLDLGRKIVAELKQEGQRPSPAPEYMFRDIFSWAGLADLLEDSKEQLIVQYLLEREQSWQSAQQQAETVIQLLRNLGQLELHFISEPEKSRLELRIPLAR